MSGGSRIRRVHRWTSIVFTLTVIANFVALARGTGAPPPWITYAPLPPLALLLLTGLYLFALPYFSRAPAVAPGASSGALGRSRPAG